ncbi:major facilitator superfamily domain-containing protein [Calycina marina]|uniref:Major facilitator superfamily domain-containing protein n=1 Tax=Calycina marina TaxID=1763456 RepID=A0A9P8CIN3_9HELO|nr:major facilitator superfamily domain-containing protein [Calycina marina]
MTNMDEKHEGSTLAPTKNSSEETDSLPPNNRELEFEPIVPSPKSRGGPGSLHHNISRTRSQNGYGCDDEGDDAEVQVADNDTDPYDVQWSGEDDPLNPRNMKVAKKWIVVIIVSLSSICVTCTSSIYTSTYTQITEEFGCTKLIVTIGLSLFIFGLGLGPMVLGPLSEFYGRRPIYITSFVFFTIWMIPSAVAKNIETMLIARFFDGLSGSAFLSVAGGTVGDLFNRKDLQLPMMVFTASPFVGPAMGPLVGGFINQYTTWRWTFYVLIIWAAFNLITITLLVPETYHPVLLKRKAEIMRKETGDKRYKAPMERTNKSIPKTIALSLQRPFQLLALEPMVTNLCLFSAILLGILYLFFGAFPLIFMGNHGFSLSQTGMCFLGLLIGLLCGTATDRIWHKNYVRLIKKREEETGEVGGSEPEYRLPPAIAGAPLVTIGLFLFAWTTYASVHWTLPIIGSAIFGMGVLLVFSGIFTFLVDAYPFYAASSLAANSFARSTFAAIFPLFGVQMYERLGDQWATSLLGFLTLVMLPFPYIFFKYGKKIRGKSRFATSG